MKPLLARLDGFAEVRLPGVFGLGFAPSGVSAAVGIDRPSESAGPARQDRRSSPGLSFAEEKLGLLATVLIVLLGLVALVALARLVVGEELFENRHWRGHRG